MFPNKKKHNEIKKWVIRTTQYSQKLSEQSKKLICLY